MASTVLHSRAGKHANERKAAPKISAPANRLSSVLLKARMRPRSSAQKQQKRREIREIQRRMEQLREEMGEIGEEQEKIREGQRQVRLKSEALASVCRTLRQETDAILKQSAMTQQRLAFMFAILRARDRNDSNTANNLALLLRESFRSEMNASDEEEI